MAGTLKDVIDRVSSLVGDPDRDFATDAYLVPLIGLVYDEQINSLELTSAPILTRVVTLLDVAAGTTSLAAYQSETMDDGNGGVIAGPLFGIQSPELVQFKQAGFPESEYCTAVKRRVLPDVPLTEGRSFSRIAYEFRDYIFYVTPLSYPIDLRIRGEVMPGALLLGTDRVTVPRMVAALAYGVAALVGIERNNSTWTTSYGDQAKTALDDVANQLVRSEQGVICRAGKRR